MTVAEVGPKDGVLREAIKEVALDTDVPIVEFKEQTGKINSDLTVGIDVSRCHPLLANEGNSVPEEWCCMGQDLSFRDNTLNISGSENGRGSKNIFASTEMDVI